MTRPVDAKRAANRDALVTRLNRVEGQVRGLRRMVQEPRSCLEILQQVAATTASLNRVGAALFRFHVSNCVGKSIADGETGKEMGELVDIFDRFAR